MKRLEDSSKKVPKEELKIVQSHFESLTNDDMTLLPNSYFLQILKI